MTDWLSGQERTFRVETTPRGFHLLVEEIDLSAIDLFASHLTHKTPAFLPAESQSQGNRDPVDQVAKGFLYAFSGSPILAKEALVL